jgi:pyrimidine operon attenuation protein / uracil phosphoribosyltransferase
MESASELFGEAAVREALERMAGTLRDRLIASLGKGQRAEDVACLIGIRRGGVPVARFLRQALTEALGVSLPIGSLDITFYRDDVGLAQDHPKVGPSDIGFPIDGRTVILVDDVLFTGRTVRAALEEVHAFGRPRQVLLAALVDRGGRELPIAPDVVGLKAACGPNQTVEVQEKDGLPVRVVLTTGAPSGAGR